MPRTWPLLALALLTTACFGGKLDDDDDNDDPGGGWDLGTDGGSWGDGSAEGDGGGGDGGGGDGGGGDGGGGDGGGGDGGGGDGGGGDGGGGDGGGGDGGDGGGGDGGGSSGDWDAWCNAYLALAATGENERLYSTAFFDGGDYDELVVPAWDDRTDSGSVARSLTAGTTLTAITEDWVCDGGDMYITGYTVASTSAGASTITLSEPLLRLKAHDDLRTGTRWSQDYIASASSTNLWHMEVEHTVIGTARRSVDAGSFDVLQVQADYYRTDLSGYMEDRSGRVTYAFAPGLGLVYSQDRLTDGTIVEERELYSYGRAFDPFSPE